MKMSVQTVDSENKCILLSKLFSLVAKYTVKRFIIQVLKAMTCCLDQSQMAPVEFSDSIDDDILLLASQ